MTTSTAPTSKFFLEKLKEVSAAFSTNQKETVLEEQDFDSLDEFKAAIADVIKTLEETGSKLYFQHKPFLLGKWSIDAKKLGAFALKHKCIIKVGTADNDYMWAVFPIESLTLTEDSIF